MPKIKSFKISDYKQLFVNENYVLTKTYRLKPNSPQYLLNAKKIK